MQYSQDQNFNSRLSILKHKFAESDNIYGDKFGHGILLVIIDRNGFTVQYISDLNDYRKFTLKDIQKLNYFIEKQYLYNAQIYRAELVNVKSLINKKYDWDQEVYCFFRQNLNFVEQIINNIHYFKYKQKIIRKHSLYFNFQFFFGETFISQLFTYIEIKQKSDFREKIILIRNNFSGKTIRFIPMKNSIRSNLYPELVASYDNKYLFVDKQLYSIENLKLITQIHSHTAKFTDDSKFLVTYDNIIIMFYNLINLRPQYSIHYELPCHSLNIQIYQIVLIEDQILIIEKNMNQMHIITI